MEQIWSKSISPMLLETANKPFDDKNYIFELKLDGIRCLAFCDKKGTLLQNRNLKNITKTYPELSKIHLQCKENCILDGEIVFVNENGVPDFQILQKRNMLSHSSRILEMAKQYPVSFVAFDILAFGKKDVTKLPLMERKALLGDVVLENEFLSVSRFIEEKGIMFFENIKAMALEGIVAKKKNSEYLIGQRSSNWLKMKNLIFEDYFVCGFEKDETGNVKNLILAKKEDGKLVYDGSIYIPNAKDKNFVLQHAKANKGKPLFKDLPSSVVWMKPNLICTVEFAKRTKTKSRRLAFFRGFRTD